LINYKRIQFIGLIYKKEKKNDGRQSSIRLNEISPFTPANKAQLPMNGGFAGDQW
jgi:hypothetical protein